MLQFNFEIIGVDGKEIWNRVQYYKINVLELEDRIYVYGTVTSQIFANIVSICSEYSALDIEVSRVAD